MQTDLYQDHEVPDSLRPYVRRIIFCDCDSHIEFKLPATPTVYHYFSWIIRGNWQATGSIESKRHSAGDVNFVGHIYRTEIHVEVSGTFRHIAAELTAAGLFTLFAEQSNAYQNRVVSITQGHPCHTSQIQSMSEEGWQDQTITDCLNRFIATLQQFAQTPSAVPQYLLEAVDMAERLAGNVDVEEMSGAYNAEFFSKQFSKYIGIPPKYFAQVLRVNNTLLALTKAEPSQLAKVANELGFFDESHLIKEIKHFFNHSPTELRSNIDVILKTFPMGSQMID